MNSSRRIAAAWMIGGAAWVINAWQGLDAVDGTAAFYATEMVWLVVHGLVLFGIFGLLRLTPPTDLLSRRGFAIAAVGRVWFVVAELVAIAVGKDEIALFPPAVVLTALGMIAGGAGVIRSRWWGSGLQLAPLCMGIYALIAILPYAAVTGDRPNLAVTLWGVTIFGVGAAILVAHDRRGDVTERPAADVVPIAAP